jgi:DNA-binding MarR family transcriptional regulator
MRKEMRNSLHVKLGNVTRLIFKKLNSQLSLEGIPVLAEQVPVLMVVYFKESAITQQDIANILQKDKSGILRSVQTLKKDGFLTIESDVEDKRKNLISLTASGKFVCEKIQALAMAFNNQIMEHFSEQERETFVSMLNRITTIIEK